jgi:PAS domain S-box-containing protein
VFSLCRDRADRIWATSNADGLLKFDGKNLRRVERSKGLRDDQPQQIVSEGNTVYAINDKGIDRIDCTTDSVTYYDVFDGDLAPNLNAVALTNNRLYSGTDNGILIYRMLSQHGDSVKPDIVIRNLQLNYKPYPLDSSTEFKYYQNNLSVTFQGIWLKNPDKLVYRYKLEGLEDNWTYSNESKTVNYNNLAPGAYRFLVQVRNEEDVWSEPEAYAFTILTPIWKRWWFWLLMLSLASIGIYVFIRYRLRSLQLENALLERRVSERTAQIEKQSRIIESKNKELEQLSLVASKTDNVVLILDRDGRLEYINESFVKRNGLTKEALVSEYGETIYELSNNPSIREIVNEAVSNKRSVSYESLNTKKEVGREIWESSTLTPIFDENGSLRKIIIIDTDVTERKRQEQVIIQKNKDITDSISYARKIQHAILPANEAIRAYIHECFVLYMTKDIVSGDFYWFTHLDGASIIAAVDCTGHGVPGAFMSLIGYNVLNRVVNENRVKEPAEILKQLNDGVLAVLHKNESESKDGMDIAICRIDHDTGIIHYAGAMRPLWIINNGELEEIKADKIPIGTKEKDRNEKIAYTTHTIEGRKNARYYIFTDGYADQFGGKKDKKYSTARFRNLLIETSALSFAEQEEALKTAHLEWKGDNEQIDDILVIGFSI